MSTSKLFEKHFGNTTSVDLKHPNTEAFFKELNAECIAEDKHKICNIPNVVQAKPEEVCKIVRKTFDDWIFGVELSDGEKLIVVDSADFNEIITEIGDKLKNPKNL